jgi:hypothetical protein
MGSSNSLESGSYGEGGTSLAFLQKLFHITSSDLHSLHSLYFHSLHIDEKYDSSSSHSSRIHYFTFCSFIHCEENVFTNHLFSFFSSFKSSVNSLTFNEFILFLYFFLSLNEKNLIEFLYFFIIYHYYEQKKYLSSSPSSPSSPLTIEQSIHHLFGNDWGDPQHIHHILSILDHDLHGELTFQQFQKGLQSNRSLLFRIVSFQMDIRRMILSESYWEERAATMSSTLSSSKMIQKIAKIRNQLHHLELEDFLHRHPPPSPGDLEDLQLKPSGVVLGENKENEEEEKDPRLISLPVANHRHSYELSEQELFYRPHTSYTHQTSSHTVSHEEDKDNEGKGTTSHEEDIAHLPILSHPPHEAPPHSAAAAHRPHKHSASIPGVLIPEGSLEFPALLHPLTDQEDYAPHYSPPRGGYPLEHLSPSRNEKTEGSSQIHTLQRLRTSHQQHHPPPSPSSQIAHKDDTIPFDHSSELHPPHLPPPSRHHLRTRPTEEAKESGTQDSIGTRSPPRPRTEDSMGTRRSPPRPVHRTHDLHHLRYHPAAGDDSNVSSSDAK